MDLPNGCKCSKIAVHPQNWLTAKASLKDKWYISYRFYDGGQCKQVTIRNALNEIPTLEKRRKLVRDLIQQETELLTEQGYNPITETFSKDYEIHPSTGFIKALYRSKDRIQATKHTKECIDSALTYISKAAEALRFQHLPISQVKRRHVKLILERVNTDRNLSATNYNHYRAYLIMLFNDLVTIDAIEINPVDKHIPKRKTTRKIKVTLSDDEREKVDKHLREKAHSFWRYLHIFFHAGARTTELFRLQVKDVDLSKQRFKLLVKKGKEENEVWKTIKNVVLPLWEELLTDASGDQFVFSRGLKPGAKPIRPDQIDKRWTKYVKSKFDIKANFYSLKHLNTTEVVSLLNEEDAARLNSHKGTSMVVKIYDTKQEDRQHERLKKVDNKFA